jgi:hypothetical protein
MGMEVLGQPQIPEKSVEQQANFEGNQSEVLFDRMQNPFIRGQLVDLLYQEELARAEYYHTEPFEFQFEMNNGEKIYTDRQGHQVSESQIKSFKPQTKEEIEKMLHEQLDDVMKVTPIEFSTSAPTVESMTVLYKDPSSGQFLNNKQKSIIEAHEKGHRLRPFVSKFFKDYFLSGFDLSKVVISEKYIEYARKNMEASDDREDKDRVYSDEEMKEIMMDYLFSGEEIAERLSQLKNYFNMRGAEKFTHEHLEYARQHYVEDTGLDNGVTQLLQAVTPETEEEFLKLINNSGI